MMIYQVDNEFCKELLIKGESYLYDSHCILGLGEGLWTAYIIFLFGIMTWAWLNYMIGK